MRLQRNRICVFTLLFVLFAVRGFASPTASPLLPLVPAGAEIVAGIEDPHNPNARRHLLFVTINNTLDLDDWLALTGVDTRREVDEVVWAAASSPQHELGEHLLLVEGRFDREHIFRAATRNGAHTQLFAGAEVLIVEPFAREQMRDTRWLAILDNQRAVFGTPWLVQEALDRYAAHESADAALADSVAQLRPDVTGWNILRMSSSTYARHLGLNQLDAPWAHLLDGADELTIGIHAGSRTRIDFAVHALNGGEASVIAQTLAQPQLLQFGAMQTLRDRLENVSVEQDRIKGSIELPSKEFEACLATFSSGHSAATSQIAQASVR